MNRPALSCTAFFKHSPVVQRAACLLILLLSLGACAPITPLPGPSIPGPAGLPSPGGLPGGGIPSPGGPSSPSPGSPGGSPGSPGSGQPSSGDPSGGSPMPSGGTPGLPGGAAGGGAPSSPGSGGPSGEEGQGEESDPTWDPVPPGNGGAGDAEGGWETSNEIPGGNGDQEGNDPVGGAGGSLPEATGADAELEGALEDFDGEILAERDVIKETADANPGNGEPDLSEAGTGAGGSADGGDEQAGGTVSGPIRKQIPNAPAPPQRGSGSEGDDIPDAKDDDIIARQLREAAMAEQDPELKEKLWEEYRKYKKG